MIADRYVELLPGGPVAVAFAVDDRSSWFEQYRLVIVVRGDFEIVLLFLPDHRLPGVGMSIARLEPDVVE
jgi:hypothetical protein